MKEKEGHIAQLLKERSFERAEFTKAAQRFEKTKSQLSEYSKLLVDREQEIQKPSVTIYELKENNENLNTILNNEMMIEDLEFQLNSGVNNENPEYICTICNHVLTCASGLKQHHTKKHKKILDDMM